MQLTQQCMWRGVPSGTIGHCYVAIGTASRSCLQWQSVGRVIHVSGCKVFARRVHDMRARNGVRRPAAQLRWEIALRYEVPRL